MIINKQQGFVALLSVIIISFVLVLVATTLSFTGYFTRFNILDSESKKRSESLADACIEQARLELAVDANFTRSNIPSTSIPIDSGFCDYSVTIISASISKIVAHSEVNKAHTYYLAKVKTQEPGILIDEFQECANYDYSLNSINCLSP